MATALEATQILMKLDAELSRRRPNVNRLDARYRGDHGRLRFASEQFSEYFAQRYSGFSDNWVGVVADAPVERLEVVGIRPDGDDREGDQELWRTWRSNDADQMSDLAFLDAVVTARSFALVWGDSDDNAVITWESPAQAIVAYNSETRARAAGAKVWSDEESDYATLYLPDEVWKFARPTSSRPSSLWTPQFEGSGGWAPREVDGEPWPLPNPLGVVPLVELQNRPRLVGEPMSDVEGTIAMQDAINLLWSYLFNAADYGSFKQRIVLGAEYPKIPVLDDAGNVVGTRPVDIQKFAVDRVLFLEDPTAKVAQWDETPLENYTKVLEVCVRHLAAQTRTPASYILAELVNVSAEAIQLTETGLVAKTHEKTEHFGRSIREVFRLVCLVEGDTGKAEAVAAGTVLWRDVETRSQAQLVDSLLKLKSMGLPTRFLLERLGLGPTEIERVMAMREDELANDPVAALAGLVKQSEAPASTP